MRAFVLAAAVCASASSAATVSAQDATETPSPGAELAIQPYDPGYIPGDPARAAGAFFASLLSPSLGFYAVDEYVSPVIILVEAGLGAGLIGTGIPLAVLSEPDIGHYAGFILLAIANAAFRIAVAITTADMGASHRRPAIFSFD